MNIIVDPQFHTERLRWPKPPVEYARAWFEHHSQYPRWRNGTELPRYSRDIELFYVARDTHSVPHSYFLGDRMIHAAYGVDSYGIVWMGSTSGHWHGWNFGHDLTLAQQWVKGTQVPELGPLLWISPGKLSLSATG
jgi:hypothetical protein